MRSVYFHGIPGHHDEVALTGIDPDGMTPEENAVPNAHLIAFSLGAHRALRFAAQNGADRIDLIAPAAPLQIGQFLTKMDGAPVFKAARTGRLGPLTSVQGVMARWAPYLLRTMMLSRAAPADRAFFNDKTRQKRLNNLLNHSLNTHRAAYMDAVKNYVEDWSDILPSVTCPVTVWHGTADTWAPITMSEALCDHLPNATLTPLQDHGHYSTLAQVLPRLAPQS